MTPLAPALLFDQGQREEPSGANATVLKHTIGQKGFPGGSLEREILGNQGGHKETRGSSNESSASNLGVRQ